jgi:hypothetical protein
MWAYVLYGLSLIESIIDPLSVATYELDISSFHSLVRW